VVVGCVLDAFPKWKRKGVRIANHPLHLDGQHLEWLSIFRPNGAVRIWQHFPTPRNIGVLNPAEVSRLVNPPPRGFTSMAIRGHFRDETRRRR